MWEIGVGGGRKMRKMRKIEGIMRERGEKGEKLKENEIEGENERKHGLLQEK